MKAHADEAVRTESEADDLRTTLWTQTRWDAWKID